MLRRKMKIPVVLLAAVAVLGGCGLSSSSTTTTTAAKGTPTTTAPTQTYTIGRLTDLTGLAASGNKTSVQGVKAGIALAASQGYTFKLDVADTQTSPASTLSGAQELVEEDHVVAVIAISSLTFEAANWLKQHNVPVIGTAEDSTEWSTDDNMFSVFGALHTNEVSTTLGAFFKMEGVTDVGALGYSISPASSDAAEAAGVSAQNAGLHVGYVNGAFPFGGTNVQPTALAMKSAGINGFTADVDPNTGFSLITALRQLGVDLKVAVLPTGYGGDLLSAGPGALQAAQGVYFLLGFEPIEMHTAATEQFASALKSVGITTDPTFAEYNGYVSVELLVQALKAAGAKPSSAQLISALTGIHDFTAAGLFGSHLLNINDRTSIISGVDNCEWITKFSGSTFHLVPGADPVCGSAIAGKTVSPAS